MSEPSLFGRALEGYITTMGITQRDLADQLEVDKSQVSRWIRGQGARESTIKTVARKLGMTAEQLLAYAVPRESSEDPGRERLLHYYSLSDDWTKKVMVDIARILTTHRSDEDNPQA